MTPDEFAGRLAASYEEYERDRVRTAGIRAQDNIAAAVREFEAGQEAKSQRHAGRIAMAEEAYRRGPHASLTVPMMWARYQRHTSLW